MEYSGDADVIKVKMRIYNNLGLTST